eukprot:718871-Prymnesium_polylepis.1
MRPFSAIASWIGRCCGTPDAESDQPFSELTPASACGEGVIAAAPAQLKVKGDSGGEGVEGGGGGREGGG